MKEINNYKVSICVPLYNVENYIERCAVSLFEQTYDNIEYVFVNDCTPDKSCDILKTVINKYPQRKPFVVLLSHEINRGVAAVRNTAIAHATGDFILWVDSDDYIEIAAVEKLVNVQQETDADVVSTNFISEYIWGSNPTKQYVPQTSKEWTLCALERKIPVHVWGRLMRRSIFVNNDLRYQEGYNMGEDFQIVPRVFYFANSITHVEEFIYHYNCINERSYSNNFTEKQSRQVFMGVDMLKNWFANKEQIYQKALCCGEAFMLGMYMVACVRSGNRKYYKELRCKMKLISSDFVKNVPIPYRITYYLKNYYALRVYCFIGHFFKQ